METKSNASYIDAEKANSLGFGNNTKLIDKKDIEGTPFKRVITEEGDFFTLGAKAITGKLNEEEGDEIEAELKSENWKLMLSIISIMVTETVAQLHLDMMKFNDQVEKGEAEHV